MVCASRAYFAGFGSPFTLATFFVPNFVSKGIFALLFPVVCLQYRVSCGGEIVLLGSHSCYVVSAAGDCLRSSL